MIELDPRMEELYERLVPSSGSTETVGGEVVRAFNRLGYRFLNDGDHVGIRGGNDTCNCAARFIYEKVPPASEVIENLWGEEQETAYSDYLEELQNIVLWYLAEDGREEMERENTEDLFDYWREEDEHDFVGIDGSWADDEYEEW